MHAIAKPAWVESAAVAALAREVAAATSFSMLIESSIRA